MANNTVGTAETSDHNRKVGRPRVAVTPEQVSALLHQGKSLRSVARALNVGVGTVCRLRDFGCEASHNSENPFQNPQPSQPDTTAGPALHETAGAPPVGWPESAQSDRLHDVAASQPDGIARLGLTQPPKSSENPKVRATEGDQLQDAPGPEAAEPPPVEIDVRRLEKRIPDDDRPRPIDGHPERCPDCDSDAWRLGADGSVQCSICVPLR
jgi:hypothetical protein